VEGSKKVFLYIFIFVTEFFPRDFKFLLLVLREIDTDREDEIRRKFIALQILNGERRVIMYLL
jgi:predicted phosphatase